MISIRPATPADYPIIRDIAYRTWPATFGSILSEKQLYFMLEMMYSLGSIKEQVDTKNNIFLVAQNDSELLGFISYELFYKNLPQTKIHKIYILPDIQGQGIGQKLIASITEISIQNNCNSLILNVNRQNKAIDFYKKNGFTVVDREDIPIGEGFFMNDYILQKMI
ncbi:GNAT family N-acetyltransferase [Arundinibacter roseus]|uniref:GNAT family N-acetyltransferase n=2 Tax=Arundinibacter roseus TaxID=2070510 RepID=A0A4R4KIX3_9BACT|nr:GNAT family N-acetyltransferase [Arundinibacter roseus]